MRILVVIILIPLVFILILGSFSLASPSGQMEVGKAFLEGKFGVPKNPEEGLKWIERAADGGDAEAQATAARMLLIGIPHQDLKKSVRYLTSGAAAKNRQCLELMSHVYLFGQGVTQNYPTALKYLEQTASDDRSGRQKLSLAFYSMMLPPPLRNYKKAERLSRSLTATGYSSAWAYCSMGLLNEYGLAQPVNYKEAAKWYQMGAKLGDCDSQLGLAGLLLTGKGIQKDLPAAVELLRKTAKNQVIESQLLLTVLRAADPDRAAGDREYQELLSRISARGFKSFATTLGGIAPAAQKSKFKVYNDLAKTLEAAPRDGNEASRLLILSFLHKYDLSNPNFPEAFKEDLNCAITMGNIDAMVVKANYDTGWDLGDLNYEEAGKFYQIASEKDHAYAQSQLGMMHALGLGVAHDWRSCIKWLTRSAEQGDTDATYALGGFYSDGRGVAPNRKTAVQFYKKAAAAGKSEGALELAILYSADDFPDIDQDLDASEKWFHVAADDGLQESNYYLGRLLGTNKPELAAESYEIAAVHGHLLSQLALGRYYLNRGVLDEADKYYSMAAAVGNKEAKESLRRIKLDKATFKYQPQASTVVFARKNIAKGDKITHDAIDQKTQKLTTASEDMNVLVNPDAAVGTWAKDNIEESELLRSDQLSP